MGQSTEKAMGYVQIDFVCSLGTHCDEGASRH